MKPYREYVAFDLETTGFHPARGAEIIEIAAVKVLSGEPVSLFQTFVKPNSYIPRHITNLTGITQAHVANAPSVQEALQAFYSFVETSPLIAHNLSFDLTFLKHYTEGEWNIPAVDTLAIARKRLARAKQEYKIASFKLGDVASYFGHTISNAHRAQDDALAVHAIYEALHRIEAK
ncbi:3'-5' exoribonuclease [Ectobacillus sp. JY-23]|uniref:3'-5' exonuclease n=1 Tax=Ectobacillus sp. JY-23 TaxID=2933872 RepID=UPI001FF30AB0|nr:exonuclease domain-containing protein [Ectobacillus sp. JY-23]UOY94084.1 3'-5' exoribonuclease [Ectobacillus sp. JY-23]